MVIRLIGHAENVIFQMKTVSGQREPTAEPAEERREVTFVAKEWSRPRNCVSFGKTDDENQLFKKYSEDSCWLQPLKS